MRIARINKELHYLKGYNDAKRECYDTISREIDYWKLQERNGFDINFIKGLYELREEISSSKPSMVDVSGLDKKHKMSYLSNSNTDGVKSSSNTNVVIPNKRAWELIHAGICLKSDFIGLEKEDRSCTNK